MGGSSPSRLLGVTLPALAGQGSLNGGRRPPTRRAAVAARPAPPPDVFMVSRDDTPLAEAARETNWADMRLQAAMRSVIFDCSCALAPTVPGWSSSALLCGLFWTVPLRSGREDEGQGGVRVDLDEGTARMRAEDLHVRDFFNIPNALFPFLKSRRSARPYPSTFAGWARRQAVRRSPARRAPSGSAWAVRAFGQALANRSTSRKWGSRSSACAATANVAVSTVMASKMMMTLWVSGVLGGPGQVSGGRRSSARPAQGRGGRV